MSQSDNTPTSGILSSGALSGSSGVSAQDTEAALSLKERGNDAFRSGDVHAALQLFSEAIELDGTNAVLLTNRSLCYASMGDWSSSARDAARAVQLAPQNLKAHCRLARAQIELKLSREAQYSLLTAASVVSGGQAGGAAGSNNDIKTLEAEFLRTFGYAARPKPTDFNLMEGLGEGNFSKIFKVEFKPSKRIFALKVIDKAHAEKIKRRHPNVHNEILMEKKALSRCSHPGIVTLFGTCQDATSLFYQMEYLDGGEVWAMLRDPSSKVMLGCHRSVAKFILASALNAVEYMHRLGIVHRDLKPENMMLTSNGQLKLVDFGTCKDLVDLSLNGQEFVGTAEYMAPEIIRSKFSGPAADLWSLGIVAFQLLYGYTPFYSPSPYMIFLKVKRAMLRLPFETEGADGGSSTSPTSTSPSSSSSIEYSLLHKLLVADPAERFDNCSGMGKIAAVDFTPTFNFASINYDVLRSHPFFSADSEWLDEEKASHGSDGDNRVPITSVSPRFLRLVHTRPARRIGRLSELALRSVCDAVMKLSNVMASNGGVRPDIEWVKKFDLFRLPAAQRQHVAHILRRRSQLHIPSVYRMLQPAGIQGVIAARCNRTSVSLREYIGFDHASQGHWGKDFVYAVVQDPMLGFQGGEEGDWAAEEATVRAAVASINKLRPRFVVVSGNLTAARVTDADASSPQSLYSRQLDAARRCLCRVSETIPVLFVPGPSNVGRAPTPSTIAHYNSQFGADYFGFFFSGLRCIVINSSLMIHPEGAPDLASRQSLWLEEEVEQAKLGATHVVLFAHHPWFLRSPTEPDSEENFPLALRSKWLPAFRHHKIRFLFASAVTEVQAFVALEGCGDSLDALGGLANSETHGISEAIGTDAGDAAATAGADSDSGDDNNEDAGDVSGRRGDKTAEDSDEDETCGTVEDSYRGPEVVLTYPVSFRPYAGAPLPAAPTQTDAEDGKKDRGGSSSGESSRGKGHFGVTTTLGSGGGASVAGLPRLEPRGSVRVVTVTEEDMHQALYSHDALPISV